MNRKMSKDLSEDEIANLQMDYASGMRTSELCQKYQLSQTSVMRLIKRFQSADQEFIKRSKAEAKELKKLRKQVAEQEKIISAFRDVMRGKVLGRKI